MDTIVNIADVRFQRNIERLHKMGARAVGELLAEIGAERSIQTIIDNKLARYVEVDDPALAVTGGDRFPGTLLHEMTGGRR